MGEAEELRERLEMASRQLELMANMRDDKERAYETLQGVLKASPGDEILFPVGGNTFVSATLTDTKTVIKGIGAEYAMQRPVEKAVEELKAEMDTLDSDIQSLSRTAQQLEERYQQIAQMIQSMGPGVAAPQQ